MTVAIIAALLVIAGMLGLVIWSVHGRVQSLERANASDISRVTTEANLERAQFELETVKNALDASNARAALLEEAVSAHLASLPNPDLSRNDVMSRQMRLFAAWAREDKNRVPAVTTTAVPDDTAAEKAGPVVSTGDSRLSTP